MKFRKRLKKIETSLTPRQAVLFWLQQRHDVGAARSVEQTLLDPMSHRTRVAREVTDALRNNLRAGLIGKRIDRAVREATIHADTLMVLVAVLEDYVRSECRHKFDWFVLVVEFRRMLREFGSEDRWQAEDWDRWRGLLIAKWNSMRVLKNAVESISTRHYDGHPLLFAEDANKLNKAIGMLEEMVGFYNSFQDDIVELTPIDREVVSDADVEGLVEWFEINAEALSLSQLGDVAAARELAIIYLSRLSRQLKDSVPPLSLYDYMTT